MNDTSRRALLTLAIPAYKREALLGRLLATIPAHVPVIVSDNGGHLPDAFKRQHGHVRFIADHEVPVAENWNRVASAAAEVSEWILMPGDDDLYYPSSFDVIERNLREHASADIAFFGHHIIDEQDRVQSTWSPAPGRFDAPHGFEPLRRGTPARPPGIAIRSDLYRRLGGFCPDFKVTAGDNHFYQRAALIGGAVFVADVVTGYRVWDAGSTRESIATPQWLNEIDLWCSRVRRFATEHTQYPYPASLHDDIYLDNLRAGIHALKERGRHGQAWRHFLAARYPLRSHPLNQARLLLSLLRPRRGG